MSRLILGQYEMLANLGSGSNGTVYKVRHHEQGYIRAIKILNGYVEDKNSTKYESFIHEYRTLTLLGNCSHPNIVSVHKADLLENKAFYEMDFIDGTPLANYIAAKQFLPLEEVIKCCRDLLSAMKYCHVGVTEYLYDREEDNIPTDPKDGSKVLIDQATRERLIAKYGIVHNDIHSSNIIRNKYDGRYILLDFGISMQGGTAVRESGLGEGALAYSAPEKILDKKVTFRSDVYSIGVVLFEILAGRVPFPSKDAKGNDYSAKYMYDFHSSSPVPSIFNLRKAAFESVNGQEKEYQKDYPDWLEKMIDKCLAKNPEDRFTNAEEINRFFLKELESYSQPGLSGTEANAIMVKELTEAVEEKTKQIKQKDNVIRNWEHKFAKLQYLRKLRKGFSAINPLWVMVVILTVVAGILFFFPDVILP